MDSATTSTDTVHSYTKTRDTTVTNSNTPVSETPNEIREAMNTTNIQTGTSDPNEQSCVLDCLGGLFVSQPANTDELQSKTCTYNINSNDSDRRLRIFSLNVCGLRSKTLFPEFHELISNYDIIGFQETKTDQMDDLTLPGFILKFKHRANLPRRRSGGIALAYKKN